MYQVRRMGATSTARSRWQRCEFPCYPPCTTILWTCYIISTTIHPHVMLKKKIRKPIVKNVRKTCRVQHICTKFVLRCATYGSRICLQRRLLLHAFAFNQSTKVNRRSNKLKTQTILVAIPDPQEFEYGATLRSLAAPLFQLCYLQARPPLASPFRQW